MVLCSQVQKVTDGAFAECTGLESVSFPEELRGIGQRAFEKCTGLKSVVLPEGLKTVEMEAFMGCTGLKSVTIPSKTTICGGVFKGCTGLESVTFPKKQRVIWASTFEGCTGLKSIVLPEGLKLIVVGAFRDCTKLDSMVLPKGLRAIGEGAFEGCTGLKSVTFPEGLEYIDKLAFSNCTKLDSLVLPRGLRAIGEGAFEGCTGLKSVSFPEGLKTIGNSAFEGCTGLKSVVLPEGLRAIGEGAFAGCSGLESVVLPVGLRSVAKNAFKGCKGLKSVNVLTSEDSLNESAWKEWFLEEEPAETFLDEDGIERICDFIAIENYEIHIDPVPDKEQRADYLDAYFTPADAEAWKKALPSTTEVIMLPVGEGLANGNDALAYAIAELDCPIDDSQIESLVDDLTPLAAGIRNEKTEKRAIPLSDYLKIILEAEVQVRALAQVVLETEGAFAFLEKYKRLFRQRLADVEFLRSQELKTVNASDGDVVLPPKPTAPKKPVTPKKPAAPEMPKKPIEPSYEKAGLFNKKKIERQNQQLKEEYEKSLEDYEAKLSQIQEIHENALRDYRSKEEAYQEAMEQYEKEYSEYERALLQYDKDVEEAIEEARARKTTEFDERIVSYQTDIDCIEAGITCLKEEAEELRGQLEQAISIRSSLYALDIVFPKYRNLPAVATISEYLESGRCGTLEGADGAYNLYEAEIRADRVITQLDEIKDSLETVKKNQYMLYHSAKQIEDEVRKVRKEMSRSITNLGNLMTEQLKATRKVGEDVRSIGMDVEAIRKASSAVAYYAEKNLELANQSKMFFGITF